MASGLCVPHQQAAHMATPTEGQNIKNTLANGEPSTHGAKRTLGGPGLNGSKYKAVGAGVSEETEGQETDHGRE